MIHNTQAEVLEIIANKALEKSKIPLVKLSVLGILAGMYISIGFIAYIRAAEVTNVIVGACMFPIGLMFVIFVGAELSTGNMLIMSAGFCLKRITALQVIKNWAVVLLANLIGAVLTAYLFGHYVGLVEGVFLERTLLTAASKVNDSFGVAFVSGILCNVFVCLAVWLAFAAKDFVGKFLGIWFTIFVFFVSGTQHVVANMFIIPAAILAGADITLTEFALNLIPVGLGNIVGGGVIVGAAYSWLYGKR